MKAYILAIIVWGIVIIGLPAIIVFLIKIDDNRSYTFEDLQVQFNDTQGERLFFQIRYYFWQLHKQKEIEKYYRKGKVILDRENFYEIIEVRGPYVCTDFMLEVKLLFYVKEKKIIDKIFIKGNMVYLFEDKTIFFDIKPYLHEIEDVDEIMCNSDFDSKKKEQIELLFEDFYGMVTTNAILTSKLRYYIKMLYKLSIRLEKN